MESIDFTTLEAFQHHYCLPQKISTKIVDGEYFVSDPLCVCTNVKTGLVYATDKFFIVLKGIMNITAGARKLGQASKTERSSLAIVLISTPAAPQRPKRNSIWAFAASGTLDKV